MKFTNNDLAKAMGLEVGKSYKDEIGLIHKCVIDPYETAETRIAMYDKLDKIHRPIHMFVDNELTEVLPKPQLTEQEIAILKGRQAEGCEGITRKVGTRNIEFIVYRSYGQKDEYSAERMCIHLFPFIKEGEEYSIAELLKGVE